MRCLCKVCNRLVDYGHQHYDKCEHDNRDLSRGRKTETTEPMRTNTTNKYEWRTDLHDDVGDLLNENTRFGAVDASLEYEIKSGSKYGTNHPVS